MAMDDEEFVEVETAAPGRAPRAAASSSEMTATGSGSDRDDSHTSSDSELALHRMSANNNSHPFAQGMGMGMDDDDDDSTNLHPLMSRLQNRLLSRNTNINRASSSKFDSLHPYTSILSLADVDQCVELENSAFPENERCSREKFIYRLTSCPELSLGIFSRPIPSEAKSSANPHPKLIAHVIATRSPAPSVTDASMEIPENWQSRPSALPVLSGPEPKGHQETGGTICVHSLAVLKEHQAKGLGSILMKAYVQRIKDSKIADRVALLAHDPLIKFYVAMGFENMGDSPATFGGGEWNNMVCVLNDADIPWRMSRPAYLR